jgi:hypothetical protein
LTSFLLLLLLLLMLLFFFFFLVMVDLTLILLILLLLLLLLVHCDESDQDFLGGDLILEPCVLPGDVLLHLEQTILLLE